MREFVYFIEELGRDLVKIGYSKNPWVRLSSLRSGHPSELRMKWLFEGTRATERYFHWLFQNHRVRGEWFELGAVIAGFRHYGVDPDTFPVPNRQIFMPSPLKSEMSFRERRLQQFREARRARSPRKPLNLEKIDIKNDPRYVLDEDGYYIRRTKRTKMVLRKVPREGVKWSSPEYREKLFGFDPLKGKL